LAEEVSRLGITHACVPYGSMARLILLYLQTEAVRTNDPEVKLGCHEWGSLQAGRITS
jgi:hypothetical protein